MKQLTEGYVVIAQNNSDTDYVQCARVLAKSLRAIGDTRPVTLITDRDPGDHQIFDNVVIMKSTATGEWKLSDDWQVYDLSPYDRTFKIESDVVITRSLDNWWELCRDRSVLVATGAKNYYQQPATSRYYRHVIDSNGLPDVYNGLTYFERSATAKKFFDVIKTVFENWSDVNQTLATPSPLEEADTDTVYAIACQLIGRELTTLPDSPIQWVHMKSRINGTTEDWTQELCWELVNGDLRINTISQLWPVHYHVKQLADQLEAVYDRQLNLK